MSKTTRKRKGRHLLEKKINANAAGIDMGAEELVVAIGADRDAEPVRTYSTFTNDLRAMACWLKEKGIETVAIESTGNYWIATYQILEEAGIEVCLVNARHLKAVPGKKTDVCDAQWLQHLHEAGLLRRSFRPSNQIASLRYLMRHRAELVGDGSRHLQLMQKVLTEMNIKLHHVFSDLDGLSAMRIIESILAGERDGEALWKLRDGRCKAPKEKFMAAIEGDWRPEYLFVLGQCLERWKSNAKDIERCDQQIESMVKAIGAPLEEPLPNEARLAGKNRRAQKNQLNFNLREEAWRIYGTDLFTLDGIGSGTVAVIMSELGSAEDILANFRSGGAFCSWLGLCPDNRITGGRVYRSKTRKIPNRVAQAFRLAAQSLWHAKSALGDFTRRMKARLGKAEGITAAAHRLARIFFAMIQTKKPYLEAIAFKASPDNTRRKIRRLKQMAKNLGFQILPHEQLA